MTNPPAESGGERGLKTVSAHCDSAEPAKFVAPQSNLEIEETQLSLDKLIIEAFAYCTRPTPPGATGKDEPPAVHSSRPPQSPPLSE
jgi:hypothetical protein